NKQVQKIKQAKKDCQTYHSKQLGCGTCKALQLCMWIDELVDTIEAMRKHIEAQQQEIEGLKNHIKDLVADKDEQAGRLMQYDTELKDLKFLVECCECDCRVDDECPRCQALTAIDT